MTHDVPTYLSVVCLLSVFPGPTVSAVVACAAQRQFLAVTSVILGVLCANLVAIVLSAGLRAGGFLLPPEARLPLMAIGALLMVLLGMRMMLNHLLPPSRQEAVDESPLIMDFAQGFLLHAFNPYTLSFFTSIFLSMAPLDDGYLHRVAVLGAVALVTDLIFLGVYASVSQKIATINTRVIIALKTAPSLAGLILIVWGLTRLMSLLPQLLR